MGLDHDARHDAAVGGTPEGELQSMRLLNGRLLREEEARVRSYAAGASVLDLMMITCLLLVHNKFTPGHD